MSGQDLWDDALRDATLRRLREYALSVLIPAAVRAAEQRADTWAREEYEKAKQNSHLDESTGKRDPKG